MKNFSKKLTALIPMLCTSLLLIQCEKYPASSPDLSLPWSGPYGGVPQFDQMTVEGVRQALLTGIEKSLENIDQIAGQTEDPSFENTIVALERNGKALDRAFVYYGVLRSNQSTPAFRDMQMEMSPILSEYYSKITQNEKLFDRIKKVYEDIENTKLSDAQKRVVSLIYKNFESRGAALDAASKERYAQINKTLSERYTEFSNNLLHDEENYMMLLEENQLGGLPESFVKSAAAAAAQSGHPGKYAVTNTRSSMDPFLTYSTQRELRKKVWENYYSRGDNNDTYDNKKIIAEILQLRRERVQLLGYDNFAQWQLQDRMAQTPDKAMALMEAVWPVAITRVAEEVKDMQAIADQNGDDLTISPWDYRYYAEKVRQAKYKLDSDQVKQYLQLDQLTLAMHHVAGRLFNYDFQPLPEGTVPVFHPDVKVWEVTHRQSGEHIGLWYLDPFARPGKRSGAWATTYRSFSTFDGKKNVLASNNSNFVKPPEGEALLISWDDAQTFFHEFGHALHFFASKVAYPTLNSGVRDYTEFQSQLLERWLATDEVIDRFLVHHSTGAPIPKTLVEKIKKAATFNQGFYTTEYLASALIDMKIHLEDPASLDVAAFERNTLAALNMPQELPMRHRTPQFSHVFSGESYACGYYGYLWADVLTADAAEAFAAAPGGFYDQVWAEKLVQYLFAPRNSIDPAEAYRLFRGRDAQIDALMRDRGFPLPQ